MNMRNLKSLATQGIEPNGGGALGSDCVSKLVEFCHCEDERSEDVAIAKSLHIDEITTSHFTNAPRNDKSPSEASEMNLTTYRPNDLTSFLNPSQPSLRKGRRVAFTLAEVLITLGIIGVVAALTLPSVIQKYNGRILVNKFKKMYSTYCQAYQRAMIDNGGGSYKDWAKDAQEVKAILSTYLSVSSKGTRKFSVYTLSGEKYNIEGAQQSYLQLSDGGAIIFSIYEGGYIITGDINSKLVLNKNIFPFSMSSSSANIGSMSCGGPQLPKRLYSGDVSNGCPPSAIDWILANDNMDYMHCPDKLIWGKKTTCK